jgi:hypothetical protein
MKIYNSSTALNPRHVRVFSHRAGHPSEITRRAHHLRKFGQTYPLSPLAIFSAGSPRPHAGSGEILTISGGDDDDCGIIPIGCK